LGHIHDGEMIPNDAGQMVIRWWLEIQRKYPNIEIDQFVVMPNHFHGILIIHDIPVEPTCVGPGHGF
jgi:REP element-mobilizing transposase RayT